jgi:ABC-type multidrug transport system fused ATPase/permease subunit
MIKNKVKIGNITAIIIILFGAFTSFNYLSNDIEVIIKNYSIINEGSKYFIDKNKKIKKTKKTVNYDGIYFDKVSLTFKNNKKIFDNFTFHIPNNKKIGIIGEIGAGKSTLTKLIMRYVEPTSGHIYLDGKPYSNDNPEKSRSHIGYVNQNPILFNRSLFSNIVYGNNNSRTFVENKIKELGLNEFFKKFKGGLDHVAGKYGNNLSGGEKQIIVILRIILQNPKIVILDEPTASLDNNTKDKVMSLLDKLIKDKITILITHDHSILKNCNNIYKLVKGKLILQSKN